MLSCQIVLNCTCKDSYVRTHTNAQKKIFGILSCFFQYAPCGVLRYDNILGFFQNVNFSQKYRADLSYVYAAFHVENCVRALISSCRNSRACTRMLTLYVMRDCIKIYVRTLVCNNTYKRTRGMWSTA